MPNRKLNPVLVRSDLPKNWRAELGWVAIDIETTGLDFRIDQIGSIQVNNGETVWIVRPPFETVDHLRDLLSTPATVKFFHHALFDLRFLRSHFGIRPNNIVCTKIAAKIVEPGKPSSLLPLLERHLNISINKSLQRSDWMVEALSSSQIEYAVKDTAYLKPLHEMLMSLAREESARLIQDSYSYIPARVELDCAGIGDVFVH